MAHRVTFIPGDGVGPDLTAAARRCIEATGVDIEWDEQAAGEEVVEELGTPLPAQVLDSIRKNKVAFKGPLTTPVGMGIRSINVLIRQTLDLFVSLRPCKWYEGVRSRYTNIDLVIVRENTEDLYAGIEFDEGKKDTQELISFIDALSERNISKDSAISIKPISRLASERIVRFAFEYAVKNKRKKVTAVHKANIMKYTDGLFLECARKVAENYKGRIEFEERIVDNMCMQLVQKPQLYDVLVLPNLYGDIISDLCAGLVGGLGVAPGANIGKEIAVFEATHGSAPKYKGKNKVNPTAMVLSGVLMLRHIGEEKAATILEEAVKKVLKESTSLTYDFFEPGDSSSRAVGTAEMADAIAEKIRDES